MLSSLDYAVEIQTHPLFTFAFANGAVFSVIHPSARPQGSCLGNIGTQVHSRVVRAGRHDHELDGFVMISVATNSFSPQHVRGDEFCLVPVNDKVLPTLPIYIFTLNSKIKISIYLKKA